MTTPTWRIRKSYWSTPTTPLWTIFRHDPNHTGTHPGWHATHSTTTWGDACQWIKEHT